MRLPGDVVPADSARVAEAAGIVQIIDPVYWRTRLESVFTTKTFLKRIDSHRREHGELWDRAVAGLAWARDSAACIGEVWRPLGDVRWPYFVRFGPPSAWWVTEYETAAPGGGADTALTFFYHWSHLDTGVVAEAESTATYPAKLLYASEEGSDVRKMMFPSVDVVSFPNIAETFDICILVGVRGDELTYATLKAGELEGSIRIRREGDSSILSQSQVHRLGLVGLVLSVTANKDGFILPFHFHAAGLPKGKYTVEARIQGVSTNASGKTNRKFSLPSPLAADGVSDILLADLRGPRGDEIAPGLVRNGRNLQGIPEAVFTAGDTISPYVEINIPEGDEWVYALSVFLKPVLKRPVGITKTSRPIVTADSAGNPIVRWAGIDLVRERRELERQTPDDQTGLELLFARVYQAGQGISVFESSFQVSPRAPAGEYWLIFRIEGRDTAGREFDRSVQKKITILRPGLRL